MNNCYLTTMNEGLLKMTLRKKNNHTSELNPFKINADFITNMNITHI